MAATTTPGDDLAAFDEEELEIRGNLTFKPSVEILPKTRRTEELQKRKIEELKRKKEAAENLRKEREREEANRRKEEQLAKKQKAKEEQARKEQERKRREEEEQKKKMDGGLDQILDVLSRNCSGEHITTCGIELRTKDSGARLRLLAQALAPNTTCMSMDLNRKGLNDEDGVNLAEMLEYNQFLQKLELEGNILGVTAAAAIGDALKKNNSLHSLNLESNNLTASGNDQKGIIKLAEALMVNTSLRVLMLSKNGITAQAGEYFVKAVEANEELTLVDLSGNDPSLSVEQLRRIDAAVQRNRERASAIRRAERRERFSLYNEEFKCRQHYMQVESMRLEIEAHEERRLNRMKARFDQWVKEAGTNVGEEAETIEELMADAQDRAEANKGKKGKKKK